MEWKIKNLHLKMFAILNMEIKIMKSNIIAKGHPQLVEKKYKYT